MHGRFLVEQNVHDGCASSHYQELSMADVYECGDIIGLP